jgi:hypothetical protein
MLRLAGRIAADPTLFRRRNKIWNLAAARQLEKRFLISEMFSGVRADASSKNRGGVRGRLCHFSNFIFFDL